MTVELQGGANVVTSPSTTQAVPRCTLCPAGCELRVAAAGPDVVRSDYAVRPAYGPCARGSTLGELIGHPRRIRRPAKRTGGRWAPLSMREASRAILEAAGDRRIAILLDGNLPIEQLAAAAICCERWERASLSLVVEPTDRELLIGLDAGGATYLAEDDLASCDGFLMIGDVFAADPRLAKGLLDRRAEQPRTPIAAIDPGGGSASKFASHAVATTADGQRATLAAVAATAGLDTQDAAGPDAQRAGTALAGCKRLGVLMTAEHGRTTEWRAMGRLAAELATRRGGGVLAAPAGANALAAVRLEAQLGTVPLAEVLAAEDTLCVAVGCDVLGMLGWPDGTATCFAAAAALPNATTDAATIVLPVAMSVELGGTWLLSGERRVRTEPLLAPPAGVPAPAEVIAALAAADGVPATTEPVEAPLPQRRRGDKEPAAPHPAPRGAPVLVLARSPVHAGAGEWTGHGSWQQALAGVPELRIAPSDARQMNVANLAAATVRVGERSATVRVRTAPELAPGTVALADGYAECRALLPGRVEDGRIVCEPQTASVSC